MKNKDNAHGSKNAQAGKGHRKPGLPGKNSFRNLHKGFRCHFNWARRMGV